MNEKISVICPAYNAEKTVSKTIESVLSQDYKNLELIIVDDVSKDSTPEIIKEYANKDSRLIFIQNQKNTGPGPAKNKAINMATGEFITFIDSDDTVDNGAYSALFEKQLETDADIVVMGYIQDHLDSQGNIKYSVEVLPPALDGTEATVKAFTLLDTNKSFAFCCTKLMRASLIKKNKITFPPLMLSEDFFFNMALLPFVEKTASVDKAYYHYVKPETNTLTGLDYVAGYYELSNKRYEASKEYCVSENAFEGETRSLIANTHIKHLSMCLIYNCSKKSGMKHKDRIEFAKIMFSNKNTEEAIKYCSSVSHSAKIMNTVFKTKNPILTVSFGRIMWIAREKLSFVFDKLK